MNIFYLLIGASLIVAMIFLALFIWSVKSGQFDDNETPPYRILFDDETIEEEPDTEDKINN
jgi:cbb3-type cytochrome oxidase maturation protein